VTTPGCQNRPSTPIERLCTLAAAYDLGIDLGKLNPSVLITGAEPRVTMRIWFDRSGRLLQAVTCKPADVPRTLPAADLERRAGAWLEQQWELVKLARQSA
jgi:hypothetical protein